MNITRESWKDVGNTVNLPYYEHIVVQDVECCNILSKSDKLLQAVKSRNSNKHTLQEKQTSPERAQRSPSTLIKCKICTQEQENHSEVKVDIDNANVKSCSRAIGPSESEPSIPNAENACHQNCLFNSVNYNLERKPSFESKEITKPVDEEVSQFCVQLSELFTLLHIFFS